MYEPMSTRPKIGKLEIDVGYVFRYFAQHVSTKQITEIDAIQYERIKVGQPFYQVLKITWFIGGAANNSTTNDGKVLYGTRHKNSITVEYYDKKMPGLKIMLPNPLEYFAGIDNPTQE